MFVTSPGRSDGFTVASGQGAYDVSFVEDIEALNKVVSDHEFVVLDENVARLYPKLLPSDIAREPFLLSAVEESKTLSSVERICRFLQDGNASKRSSLLVIGGGITQDVGAFVAHIYYRGIPFTYVPTTLLSMADSCIGAKCGLNLGDYKNQIGFFRAPKRVIAWPGFTSTLEPDDLRSGFGEALKLSIIAGRDERETFLTALDRDGFQAMSIKDVISSSLRVKRGVIEEDEYEAGLRKILNYGHTFGHALEAITNHAMPHGLAVAWGVDIANYISFRLGLLKERDFALLHDSIARHFAFTSNHSYDAKSLALAMARDKKAKGSAVTLLLLNDAGQVSPVECTLNEQLTGLIAEYMAELDIFSQP